MIPTSTPPSSVARHPPDRQGGAPAGNPLRALERALLLSFVLHGLAMLSMAVLLLPGQPGGPTPDLAGRMAYVAADAWRWRLGWLPWQLTALSDLLIGLALVRTPGIPRRPAWLTLGVTVLAVLPDQIGQWLWVTQGMALAQGGSPAAYAAFETATFPWIAGWGGLLYTLAAVGWSVCFARAGLWMRGLTGFSTVLWGLFALAALSPLLPDGARPPAAWVAAANAAGFVLLLIWMALILEQVLRRSRPVQAHGRDAAWRHPDRRWWGRLWTALANSRLLRALCAYLPTPAFLSDIRDVIYVNYMVDAAVLAPLVPPGLALQRLGPGGHYALFSFLTYRHGHFGPALLGPLRGLLPSPIQSNWRIYVTDPRSGRAGVYFVTNAIDSTLHALAARLLSEGMPMHVLRQATLQTASDGGVVLRLDSGAGTAPAAEATLAPAGGTPTSGPWQVCFASYRDMLAYAVPQDRAFSVQPWAGRITRQEIALGIPLEACVPLVGVVQSATATALVGPAVPFCFRVPRVAFRFARQYAD